MKNSHTYTSLTLALLCATSLLSIPMLVAQRNVPGHVLKVQPAAKPIEPSASGFTPAQAHEAYGKIEMGFEASSQQTGSRVNFMARGAGYTLFLKPTEAVFVLATPGGRAKAQITTKESAAEQIVKTRGRPDDAIDTPINEPSKLLRMKLVGADKAAAVKGTDELPGKINYFIGNDPAKWRANIPTFSRVRYAQVYPGIDVVYYGNQRRLEYDFVIAPGSDARAVKLQFDGADKVEVDVAGDLLLTLGESIIRQPKPIVYQEVAGKRREVEAGYVVGARGQVGFEVGEYDHGAPLVIDPTIVYSTYVGGSAGDQALEIEVDPAGNAYITGFTTSTNFPTANAIQAANGGFQEVFVTKINAAGTAFVYSTYLGGSGQDQARGIAVDSAGNAYVTGFTGSTNFPVVNALKSTNTDQDAFVTKINATGSALVYSTYLGGSGESNSAEFGEDIAVDSVGNAYVTGSTFSNNFPIVNAIQSTFAGFTDAYVTKINAAGSALVYSTYLGGSDSEIGEGINVDAAGNAYVTGDTTSTNFPTANAVQAATGGGQDAFVTKINAAGSAFVYSTYLGGSAQDDGEAIAPDSSGNTYLTGNTFSTNFPTANAIQPANGGTTTTQDGFVTKLNPTGSAFVYSTYLGGTGGEIGFGIGVDSSGNAYIVGGTGSLTSFPVANAIHCTSGGAQDVFVTKLNAAGSAFIYSTYLGGTGQENGRGIGLDSAGNAYVAGFTRSSDFPVLNAIQNTYGGDPGAFGDAFVIKLNDALSPSPCATPTPSPATIQFSNSNFAVSESAGFIDVNVTRSGDTSTAIAVDYTTSDNSGVIPDEAQAVALCAGVNSVALSKCDFNTALGTLRFAAGETTKSFTVLLTQDSYVEGSEFAPLTLSNPTNGAVLGNQSTAMLQIIDDAIEPTTNAIDDARNFVRQHYHDFLNREPDQAGWDFWTDNITKCNDPARRPAGQTVDQCLDKQRETTSGAFFLSPEFQYTGSYIYSVYKGSLGRNPTFLEFMRDLPQLVNGIIVGGVISGPAIEANRAQYLTEFAQRAEFLGIYGALNNQGYVDKLFQTTGTTVSPADRQALVTALNSGTETRATVLHKVVNGTRVISESQVEVIAVYGKSFFDSQTNPAFVQMEYFGYMRRNEDTAGFDFWLGKLNFYGDFITAEMVRSFLLSPEYRRRFGPN